MKITSRGLPPRGAPYFLRPSPSNVPSTSSKGISRGLPRRARLQNHLLDLCEIECPPPLPSQQSRRASPRLIPSCVELRRDKPTPTSLTWCANPAPPLLRRGLIGAGRAA